jgi:hypothetical protein
MDIYQQTYIDSMYSYSCTSIKLNNLPCFPTFNGYFDILYPKYTFLISQNGIHNLLNAFTMDYFVNKTVLAIFEYISIYSMK